MNREPLSQSTDNYSPRLMSMDCPQHSGGLTHSSPDTRNCKRQRFHERWFPAEVPEKPKVRVCGRAPPPPVPGTTLLLYYSSFLDFKITSTPVKGYCKSLLREPKITKDMNIATLVFPSLFIPKATRVLPGEFKILLPK